MPTAETIVRRFLASKWAYHGTKAKHLPSLMTRGLVVGFGYEDRYSEYDDGKHIFFSDDPEYTRKFYGDTLLRFPWPSDAKPDQNTYGRYLPNQFVTKKPVSANRVEVETSEGWQTLRNLRLAFKYQPKESKKAKVKRLTDFIRAQTGVGRGVAEDMADAVIRKRDLKALAYQKKWPVGDGKIVGPKGGLSFKDVEAEL